MCPCFFGIPSIHFVDGTKNICVFSWAVVEVAGSLILDVFEGSYEAYLKSMAMDGTWGDHVTLQVGKTATP